MHVNNKKALTLGDVQPYLHQALFIMRMQIAKDGKSDKRKTEKV